MVLPRACGAAGAPGDAAWKLLRFSPARAGPPFQAAGNMRHVWVLPRACGATIFALNFATYWTGSPPRVRGHRAAHEEAPAATRFSPARAGPPDYLSFLSSDSPVLPRACGATSS